MTADRRRASLVIGLALAVLIPITTQAAGGQAANETVVRQGELVLKAVSFVRTLAKGDFQAAEADFTDQMKQAAPPAKLSGVWQGLISNVGPFQDTGYTKIVVQNGLTIVVVKTDFKSRALGIAVTFDSTERIAGMHFVPPPPA